jgi:hypothetical protein
VTPRIEIYSEQDELIETLDFKEREIKSQEQVTLEKVLDTADYGAGKYHAVGNPYPSTISVADFYTENPNAGTLYFWRKTNATII